MDTATSFDPPPHCVLDAAAASSSKAKRHHSIPPPPPPPLPADERCPKDKPGLTAFAPGSEVLLELPMGRAGSDAHLRSSTADPRWKGSLSVTYLWSYQSMGRAALGCEGACTCKPTMIDGHISDAAAKKSHMPSRFVSVWKRVVIDTYGNGTGPSACMLRLVLLNTTLSGGTKFKLGSLTLKWLSTEQDLMSKANKYGEEVSCKGRHG